MRLYAKLGRAFSRELWRYRSVAYYRLSDRPEVWTGMRVRDEITSRPTILNSPRFNPTMWNLFGKNDPLDYYRERGFLAYVSAGLTKKTTFDVMYQDCRQSSEAKTTEYSFTMQDDTYRDNPAILQGTLRSLATYLRYDSRPHAKIKGREAIKNTKLFTLAEAGVEAASPDLIDNDFDFVRYYVRLKHTGHVVLPGIATLDSYVGASSRSLPPQRYFTVDFTYKFVSEDMFFKTVGGSNFSGNRAAALYLSNNFGPWLFRKSGLPLIKQIPLSLSIYGGAFWTDFRNHPAQSGDEAIRIAPKAYSEIGFAIGRIPPFNNRLTFTWQMSDYDTNRFQFGLGIDL